MERVSAGIARPKCREIYRLLKIVAKLPKADQIVENKLRKKQNKYNGTTMKSDSGRGHMGEEGFLVLVGMRGNFEGTHNRVIDG